MQIAEICSEYRVGKEDYLEAKKSIHSLDKIIQNLMEQRKAERVLYKETIGDILSDNSVTFSVEGLEPELSIKAKRLLGYLTTKHLVINEQRNGMPYIRYDQDEDESCVQVGKHGVTLTARLSHGNEITNFPYEALDKAKVIGSAKVLMEDSYGNEIEITFYDSKPAKLELN